MKKLTKKSVALLLCVLLGCTLFLSACGPAASPSPSPTPTATPTPTPSPTLDPASVKITDGYYFLSGPNTGNMPCFIHFSEDGTYYGKYFSGGVTEAGTYTVVTKDMQYIADPGPDGNFGTDDDVMATAHQVVQLTNYATGAVQEVAFDNDKLCDMTLGGMSTHDTLDHVPDYVYDPAVEETPIPVRVFYYDQDTGSSLTLYHDKTFNDFTTAGENGTWTMAGNVFTLTTSDNKTYTLTVSDDGKTATYVKGSDTLDLTSTVGDTPIYSFTADTTPDGLPMQVTFSLDCMADGTCQVVMTGPGFDAMVVDTGTYTIANMVYISFDMQSGGHIDGAPDMSTATADGVTVNVPYKADLSVPAGDSTMPISVDCTLTGQITAG